MEAFTTGQEAEVINQWDTGYKGPACLCDLRGVDFHQNLHNSCVCESGGLLPAVFGGKSFTTVINAHNHDVQNCPTAPPSDSPWWTEFNPRAAHSYRLSASAAVWVRFLWHDQLCHHSTNTSTKPQRSWKLQELCCQDRPLTHFLKPFPGLEL